MGDEWLNDSLVVYIENEIFDSIDNELILNRFQNMDSHINQLSRSTKHSVDRLENGEITSGTRKNQETSLRNRMRDEWLNDSLVVYIEKEIFDYIDNQLILNRFQNMDSRRNQLSRSTKHSVA